MNNASFKESSNASSLHQEFRVMIGAKPNLMAQQRATTNGPTTTKPGNAKTTATTTTTTATGNCVGSNSVTASPAMMANNVNRK